MNKIAQDISGTVASPLTQWPSPSAEAPKAGVTSPRNSIAAFSDDLSREVYCILGMPIDAIEMPAVLRSIEINAATAAPFVISTPNLHFLVNCHRDSEFRDSLLMSNLCPADGMPIVWIARLLGIPIKHRVAGSDIFEALKAQRPKCPLKVFLFGSTESVAAAAARTLNANLAAMSCVGWTCPGFDSVDALSADHFIDKINSSNADFLVVALGAKKGQLWLERNCHRLRIPIRAHLGAAINFQAGTVARAPEIMQRLGLEWLWRIKEEPYLWRRYLYDGLALIRLMLTHIMPLTIRERSLRRRCQQEGHDLVIKQTDYDDRVILGLSGFAIASQVEQAISCFSDAMTMQKQIVIDFSQTQGVDTRFLGFLLMVKKALKDRGAGLELANVPRRIGRTLRLNGLGYLLPSADDL